MSGIGKMVIEFGKSSKKKSICTCSLVILAVPTYTRKGEGLCEGLPGWFRALFSRSKWSNSCFRGGQKACQEKNCHVEKFQLSMYDNCGVIENFSTCGEILGNFETIYALSCGEKMSPKVHLWRKNDKYEVCGINTFEKEASLGP